MFLILSLAYATTPESWCAAEKSLYAWNCATDHQRDGQSTWWHLLHNTNGCGTRLVNFASAQHFSRVYLYVGAMQWDWETSFSQGVMPDETALADLTTQLRAAGVEPWALWYLNDNPDNLNGIGHVEDLVDSVAAFNLRHPDGAFAGVHGDQEPNDSGVYADYLSMNQMGLRAATQAGIGWGASLKPAWLTLPRDAPFVEDVLPMLTMGTLMDYTDDPVKAASQGEQFLTDADAAGVLAEVALETGSTDPTPGVSFGQMVRSDPDGFYEMVGTLDVGFQAHNSYRGIAIHDYAQFFADLYGGVEPYDYQGGLQKVCPEDSGDSGDANKDTAEDSATSDTSKTPGTSETSGNCGCSTSTGNLNFWWMAVGWMGWKRREKLFFVD